jgi:beta-galactosidase
VTFSIPSSTVSTFRASYTIYGSGDIIAETEITPGRSSLPEIPGVGMLLTLPPGFETVTWYGRGPEENYCDRNTGSDVGVYVRTVDDFFVPYMEAQETGNRTDVRWVSLTNPSGTGLLATGLPIMEINALHYTPRDLECAKHPYELHRRDEITLRLN